MSCRRNDGTHFDNQSNLKSCFSFFFLLRCFLKERENMSSVFLRNYRNTCDSLGKLKKAVETLA